MKVAHSHFNFVFLESTFFNDVVKHQLCRTSTQPFQLFEWYLPSPSRHSCLQSHPPLTLLGLIPEKHFPVSPASLAPCGTTSAAGERGMIHATIAYWAHVWPARVPSRPSDVGTPWAPNGKAKLSQPTQGRAEVWHLLTAPQRSIKGARSRETCRAERTPRWLLRSLGVTRAVLATIRAFGLRGSLLTLGTGSMDGERIDCNGPGETVGRTQI